MFQQMTEKENFFWSSDEDGKQNQQQSGMQIRRLPPQPRGLFDACTKDWNSMPFFLEEEQLWYFQLRYKRQELSRRIYSFSSELLLSLCKI